MRPLPEQAVHLPFGGGPYRMAMYLVLVAESEWFKLDSIFRRWRRDGAFWRPPERLTRGWYNVSSPANAYRIEIPANVFA